LILLLTLIAKVSSRVFDRILQAIIPPSAKVILGYDIWDIDKSFIFIICLAFYGVFLIAGIAVGYSQYHTIITEKFMSLDPTSG